MTATELAAVIDGIVPAIRALVAQEITKVRAAAAADLTAALAERAVPRDGRDGLPGRDGAPGEKGLDGLPGKDGRDGQDGLGFDDFEEEYDGERTFIRRYRRGDRVKEFRFTVAMDLYRGTWVEGRTYERGDGVTWAGSEWHCHETTRQKPGDGSKAWTLKVKRGRDGRDAGR
jgi:hypothetical protein